ncbi:hypothetical protein JRQ81_017408 [Phrynocephalus forsythii]|uniref:Transmembrane protein 254 n=1 Tax=Phrynocephalus forsythii TaxID=171643 RepID=A0A9Q1AZX5_9SAUR|nr:hypothetical protein JRQ81_017408 [Phrynocephalus forsythii]
MAAPAATKEGSNYFRRTTPFWMVVILAGMGYYGWVVFAPTTIPYNWLGPLGHFTKYLVENHSLLLKNGYLLAWLVHIGEALYALKICKRPHADCIPTELQPQTGSASNAKSQEGESVVGKTAEYVGAEEKYNKKGEYASDNWYKSEHANQVDKPLELLLAA